MAQPPPRFQYQVDQETILSPEGKRTLVMTFRFPQDAALLTRRKCPQCQREFGIAGMVRGSGHQICPYCGITDLHDAFHTQPQRDLMQKQLDEQETLETRYFRYRHFGLLGALLTPDKGFRWRSVNDHDPGHAFVSQCGNCGQRYGLNAPAPYCPYCGNSTGVPLAVGAAPQAPAYNPALLEAGVEQGKFKVALLVLTMPIWLIALVALLLKGCS